MSFTKISIEANVKAPVDKVWKLWTGTEHITKWNSPSPEWHTPRAENDLKVGGRFLSRMEARDGSMGFDFGGVYNEVKNHEAIAYAMDDNRTCKINFKGSGNETKVDIVFDAENQNPVEFQKAGWQAILDSFKKYAETN